MRIHHIAIVVRSLQEARKTYRRMGMDSTREVRTQEKYPGDTAPHAYLGQGFFDPKQGFPVFWAMQPLGRTGPLARFLAQRGPGFHHVGLLCTGLARAKLPFVRRPHFFRTDREIRALLDPSRTGGMLIELLERKFAARPDGLPPFCLSAADHVGVRVGRLAPFDRFFRFLGFTPEAVGEDSEFRMARYRLRGFHVALFEPKKPSSAVGFDHVALPLEGMDVDQVLRALRRFKIPFRGPYRLPGETSIKVFDPSGGEWELLVR